MRYFLLIIIFVFLKGNLLFAKSFRNLTMEDGLSHSVVYCVGQDKDGFVWLGTVNGLNIYDGNQFKYLFFDSEDSSTIPSNTITDLEFDNDSVWIGTNHGLCIMSTRTRKARRIDLDENIAIRDLFLDKDGGVLWVGTNSGLVKYYIKEGNYELFNTSNSSITHDIIRAIYKDSDDNLWLGTYNELNVMPANSKVFKVVHTQHKLLPHVTNNLILSILPDEHNVDSILWVGTRNGLCKLNRTTLEIHNFNENNSKLANSTVKSLFRTKEENLWMGTDFGLGEMNLQTKEIKVQFHNPFEATSITNDIIWDIFEDEAGAIWFATNNGVSILSKSDNRFGFIPLTFQKESNISGYEIRNIKEDKDSTLWLSTQFGVVHYHPERGIIETFNSEQGKNKLISNNTNTVLNDQQGRTWFCTKSGLFLRDVKHNMMHAFTADVNDKTGLRSNYVRNIYEFDNDLILVYTVGGLHQIRDTKGEVKIEYLRDVGDVMNRGKENLWYIINNQLIKVHPRSLQKEIEHVFSEIGPDEKILSLYEANDEIMWLGLESGLIKYHLKTKTSKFFSLKSSKKYPIINILTDKTGDVWCSSYSAIIRFSPISSDFEIYPSGDEIPISRFKENCCTLCSNGDLIFGGHDGFLRFSPNSINKSSYSPPVVISGLKIANQTVRPYDKVNGDVILDKEITFVDNLELKYSDRSFSLELSSLQYDNRNGIRYTYRLDGEDNEWKYLSGGEHDVTYSNLRAGNYTFLFKGTNSDGVWNSDTGMLNIHIKPPLWASVYMIIIYIILIIVTIIGILYYHNNRVKVSNTMSVMHLEKEHADALAKTRQKFLTNISHEFKTPLSLIIGPVEHLINSSNLDAKEKKYVSLIENNARRLLWLNNQLSDFRQMENKSIKLRVSEFDVVEFARIIFNLFSDKAEMHHISYLFKSEKDKCMIWMDLRKFETLLFNLLSNAFKYTPDNGEILVILSVEPSNNAEQYVCLMVKDNGIGIPKSEHQQVFKKFYQSKNAVKMNMGSGIGLNLVNEYTKIHNGHVELVSDENEGAEFKVFLPLGDSILEQPNVVLANETNKPLVKNINEEVTKIEDDDPSFNFGKPYLLIVDDEQDISDFIKMSLKDQFKIQVASNGEEALQFITQKLPQIIISDINMPQMDGMELIKKLKSNPKTSHIPVIILTGKNGNSHELEGLQIGADVYLSKPFKINILRQYVNNLLKQKELIAGYVKLQQVSQPKKVQIKTHDEKFIEKVVNCIEVHIADPNLDVTKLCKKTGFSHSILYRKIKNLNGQTVNEFIRTIRLKRAEQMLSTKKFTVQEVMDQTGFSSHSYFSKCFRKVYDVSPKEYVNRL